MARGLTPKQARFVQEYVIDLNGKQAAIRSGVPAKNAESQASKWFRNSKVRANIDEALARQQARTAITQDRVLEELALLAFSDIGHYRFDPVAGKIKVLKGAPRGARRAISAIEIETFQGESGTTTKAKIKLWPKPAPLELAGKHVGLFSEKRDADSSPTEIHIHGNIEPPQARTATAQDSTLPAPGAKT